tara:strand:- start:871 stop:1104 length:234 start_codon:yes stop_codon:yes gene_type:complete
MKIETIINAGPVSSVYLSSWGDGELELTVKDGSIKVELSEEIMKRLHERLGEKLTGLAQKRLEQAKQLTEDENTNDE